jgi:hypothetical protein
MSRTTFSADMSLGEGSNFLLRWSGLCHFLPGGRTNCPSGLAANRLKILRHAYDQALKEPDLVEESKKRNWDLDHIRGEKLAALANSVMDSSPQLVERLKELLAR